MFEIKHGAVKPHNVNDGQSDSGYIVFLSLLHSFLLCWEFLLFYMFVHIFSYRKILMINTAEREIQELKSEEMWIFWRWILNLWSCHRLYLALQVALENLTLKTFKAYRALVWGKGLQDSMYYL